MREYNFISVTFGRVVFVVGRPVVPLINRWIDRWERTCISRTCRYYAANMQQIMNDRFYNEQDENLSHEYVAYLVDKQLRKDWAVQHTIIFMGSLIPGWIKRRIDTQIENHYEKEHRRAMGKS